MGSQPCTNESASLEHSGVLVGDMTAVTNKVKTVLFLLYSSPSSNLQFRLLGNDKSMASILQQHNDHTEPLFIGLVRMLQTPNTLPPLTIMQAVQDEYITQHTTAGTIIRTDHRIAVIAGYMSGEVTGMSAYDYVYSEDLEYTLKAQSLSMSLYRIIRMIPKCIERTLNSCV